MKERPVTVRIVRDHLGLKLVFDHRRVEHEHEGASLRLTPLEEAWLSKDIADAHAARVFKDPEAFRG
jgi:hypothetical protein